MNYKFKTKPYKHQLTALEKSWNRATYAYFMEMGTGKTKVLIDNLAMLYDKGKINGALIIAPKGVVGTWYNQEIPAHLPNHIENVTVLWQANINKKQQEKLESLFEVEESLHILVMNVEALSTTKGAEFAAKFLRCHETLMAIDESTTIKNPSAKRTKNIIDLSTAAKYRRIMTGSPVTKNPLDLYSQCKFLSPWLLDFTSYYAFRNRYALMKTIHVQGRSIQVVDKFQNLGELSNQLKGFSYRVLKEDCLDLPDKIYMKRNISLTSDQLKLYDQMRKEALAVLNGKKVTTVNALTQLMRLHQITCGHFTSDDGMTQPIKNNRMSELMNVLEETEGKAIIWAHYQYDITNIIKEVVKVHGPGSIVDYYGLTPQDERQPNIKKFQSDPKCRFMVGTPSTGGYGITLTAANTVIYYSNGYDLEKRLQSEDRAHRIGQQKSVTYVDILADKTVDEKIVKSLRKKINIASEVLGEELKSWI
ncbi:SNF2 family superfamily II DNA/RNA helicase [uncultured Mediterranean phage]|nr:SNF2 family superfamily II DNA/RNA helicase [uncultured Mediterranean phage]